MGFLNGLSRVANGAVKASPYISQMLAQRQAKEKADIAAQLQQLHQQSQDNTSMINTQTQAGVSLANIDRLHAQADALRNPQTGVRTVTDANGNISLVPTKVSAGTSSVSPISTGIAAPKKIEQLKTIIGPDGKRTYVPASQAVGKEAPEPAPPQSSFTTFQDYDPAHPDAPPTTRTLNTHTGQPGGVVGTGKAPATKIESATNTAAKARLEAAISEMNNAHANMSEFEQSLANGTRKINAGSQVLQRVANAFTHDDPLSQLTQSGALAALNSTDPDLARYIRRGLSFAEGESMVSQRPSDFRTRMAAFLSTAASGASPEMIHDIEGRRKAILDPLNATIKPSAPPPNVPHPPSKNDRPGPPDIGAGAGADAESAWAAKNPPKKGETFDQYHARYQAATKGGDE